jgi:hypothetical protein
LITNSHNLSGRRPDTGQSMSSCGVTPTSVEISYPARSGAESMIRIVEPLVDQDGTPLWLEHPEYGSRVDVVALPLTNVHNVQTYPYEIDPEHGALPLAIPADVSIVGFPFGTSVKGTAIWVRGTIASEPGIDYDDLPRFLVDARTRVGQSGSPVIRVSVDGLTPTVDGGVAIYNGPVMRLVGVYSGRINQESDLGYVWRVGVIKDILTGSKRAGGPV